MFATSRTVKSAKWASLLRLALFLVHPAAIDVVAGRAAQAPVKTGFDSLAEGFLGDSFTSDGIHFFNPIGVEAEPTDFAVDANQANLGTFGSRPNVLVLGAYGPGIGLGWGPVKEFSFSLDGRIRAAQLDVFVSETFNNEIALEAILDGTVVARRLFTSSPFNAHPPGLEHQLLSITGVEFDFARMISRGALQSGASSFFVDNVALTPITHGDFDADGDIDGLDFLIWQRGLGLTGQASGSTGDADADGDVDGHDLDVWRANFDTGASAAADAAVPEPRMWLLAAIGLMGVLCCCSSGR
jgi:hypothetical protein